MVKNVQDCFVFEIQGDGQVVVKHVVPDSPVHVPVYPSPQIHIQPSAPGEISVRISLRVLYVQSLTFNLNIIPESQE